MLYYLCNSSVDICVNGERIHPPIQLILHLTICIKICVELLKLLPLYSHSDQQERRKGEGSTSPLFLEVSCNICCEKNNLDAELENKDGRGGYFSSGGLVTSP